MNNTPYQLDCESLCEWCAKGLPVYVFGEGIGGHWHDLLVPSQKNCTARSRGEFEASLIARAEQAEKDKRIAERAIDKCNLEVAQELAASRAEVRTLREALEMISAMLPTGNDAEAYKTARAALQSRVPKGEQ